eukprot:5022537-Pyramimonas_sp.AAC.1
MRASFYRLGNFWFQKGAPLRWKRCVLLCNIVNTALSGLEAFLPSPKQLMTLQYAVAALARKAMRGEASWEDMEGRRRSLSSLAVLDWWRIVPIGIELQVRRLRWFQARLRRPAAHAQYLAALLGTMSDGVGVFTDAGT